MNQEGVKPVRLSRLAIPVAVVLGIALCAGLLVESVVRNDGTFSYSLDDPYIHLAFSEQLAVGHFGLHPSSLVMPSSSVLWPWLLVPGAGEPWHDLVPLVWNGLALVWILGLLRQILQRVGLASSEKDPHLGVLAAGLLLLCCVLLNLPFLVSAGMEHTLQVALALAVLRGLLDIDGDRGGWSVAPLLLFAVFLGPLVRYESLAISAVAVLFLLLRRRWVLAVLGLLVAILPLALFTACLLDMGLPPLPSSVLAKSGWTPSAGGASWLSTVDGLVLEPLTSGNVWRLADQPAARRLATVLGLLWATAWWSRQRRSEDSPQRVSTSLTWVAGLALAAHLLVGRFAATERYGVYVLAFGGVLLLCRLAPRLRLWTRQRSSAVVLLGLAAVTLPWQADTVKILLQTPQACHNIYQQQYQMHRFVTEYYHAPIAVNDLGWVSFRNPNYVLDLWGIGDEASRQARLARDPSWPARQVEQHDVGAALVYDRWFRERLPEDWIPVAYLRLVGERITPGDDVVTFYATRPESFRDVLKSVRRLRATLPSDTQMRLAYRRERR